MTTRLLDAISARIWGITEDDARKLRELVVRKPRETAQRFMHLLVRSTGPNRDVDTGIGSSIRNAPKGHGR